MNEKIKAARQELGSFFKERREQMSIPADILAGQLGITTNTLKGIETGRFPWDVDMQHNICALLEIKPYFSATADPHGEDLIHNRKSAASGDYHGYYISENLLLHPEQLAIVKLTYPRLFLRFNYGDSYFTGYDDWKANIAVQEWIDGERPGDDEIDYILTQCWNFLALHEREEERLADEMKDENF
jgi:DNA-binding XRE family transcriptional regulator